MNYYMNQLQIKEQGSTLVDLVEEKLLKYLRDNDYCIGNAIPNEVELSSSLGVARSVLREALSRLKMIGMIDSRTRRGMIIKEPSIWGGIKRLIDPRNLSEDTLCNLLEFRIMLETGMTYKLFENINSTHLKELENIIKMEEILGYNEYSPMSEVNFHSKLYEITGNSTIMEFEKIIYPIMEFAKEKFHDYLMPLNKKLQQEGKLVSHADLFKLLADRNEEGYKQAIEQHLNVYKIFLSNVREHQ